MRFRGMAAVACVAALSLSNFAVHPATATATQVHQAIWSVVAPIRVEPLVHLATGVSVDRPGNAYVADSVEGRVKKISPTGKLLASWGSNSQGRLHWYPTD